MLDRRWADVAPETHPFDAGRVEAIVRPIIEARRGARVNDARDGIVAAVEDALVDAFGDWVIGWRWAVNSGGPIRQWCCSSHSVLPDREDGPEPTIQRVIAAVADWRGYLEELAHVFDELRAETRDQSLDRVVEHAVARIVDIVVARTNVEDAWYATLTMTIAWFVEDSVYEVERVRQVIQEVTSGYFASWTPPTDDVVRRAIIAFGTDVSAADAPEPHDAIAEWTAIRMPAFDVRSSSNRWEFSPSFDVRPGSASDGHARYIDEVDRTRDPVRADRMSSALLLARDSAARGLPLSFDQLAEWQAIVLGHGCPVAFRTTEAFGKAGREVYGLVPDIRDAFEKALSDTADRRTPVAVRAARVYLDICFFHPFEDGNARAARLALDHVLSSAGLFVRDATPLFTLSRAANDARGAASFAALIARLSGTMAV